MLLSSNTFLYTGGSMIILSSRIHTVEEILKETKSEFFRDVNVGDKLVFRTGIEDRGSDYASYFTVENLTNHKATTLSQLNMCKRLALFKLKEGSEDSSELQ
jgi:hypothetical protein